MLNGIDKRGCSFIVAWIIKNKILLENTQSVTYEEEEKNRLLRTYKWIWNIKTSSNDYIGIPCVLINIVKTECYTYNISIVFQST